MSKSNSAFPTVGDSVLSYVGSGKPTRPSSANVKMVSKGTEGRGKSPTGTKAVRGNVKLNETNGPKCRVVAKLYQANAAAASEQQRNVRIVKSATGVSDFWAKRQYGSAY